MRARAAMLRQSLVLGVAVPLPRLLFRRKLEDDHAAAARRVTFKVERMVVVSDELAAVAFEYREKPFFIFAVLGGILHHQVDEKEYRNIWHGGFFH